MTKQEAIREGIEIILGLALEPDTELWEDEGYLFMTAETRKNRADCLMQFLHDNDVVIKARDIQPKNNFDDLTQSISEEGNYDIVAVEPLVVTNEEAK